MIEDAFCRTKMIIGEDGFESLQKTFVVIVGIGAVGGYVLEALVRAGIGKIRVVDCDVLKKSNLNRQILALNSLLEKPKVDVAAQRVYDINPNCILEKKQIFVSKENIPNILEGNPDVLIDAIDVVKAKEELLSYAALHGIKTFSAMGAALRMHPEFIRIATLDKTNTCPLAALMRKNLRRKKLPLENITCIYSEEVLKIKPETIDEHGKRILGSLPTLTGIVGLTLANKVILDIIKEVKI